MFAKKQNTQISKKQNIQIFAEISPQETLKIFLTSIFLIMVLLFIFIEPSLAADPFSGLGNKIKEATTSLITMAKYIVTFILVVMCVLAIFSKVNWTWVAYVFAGAVCLFIVDEISAWLTASGK